MSDRATLRELEPRLDRSRFFRAADALLLASQAAQSAFQHPLSPEPSSARLEFARAEFARLLQARLATVEADRVEFDVEARAGEVEAALIHFARGLDDFPA